MRVGIVGLGSMGKRRIRNLRQLGIEEIVGLDPNPARRDEAASTYGIRVVESLDDLMAVGPQALVISTPPDRHMEYAMVAVEAGIHFFTEASVLEAGMPELIRALVSTEIVAAPSCTMRFNSTIQEIASVVRGGSLGPVLGFTYHSGQYLPDWHPWEDYREYYVSRRETGGAREIVVFELSWLTWIFGYPEAVKGLAERVSGLEADIDDMYQVVGRFGGALGHLLVDVVCRVPTRKGRIIGEAGTLEWDVVHGEVRVLAAGATEWETTRHAARQPQPGYVAADDMYVAEMTAFLDAVAGRSPFPYTFEEDLSILELLRPIEIG